jgi:RNA-directed DNA polymerase
MGKSENVWEIFKYKGAGKFVERICFDSNSRLPIGYISSPIISNAVMHEFDTKLQGLVLDNKVDLGNGKLTRYADDIIFSTDLKGACEKFLQLIRLFAKSWASPTLTINEGKTIFSSRLGGSAIVTGLRVCNDSHVTVTREYK